MYPKQYFDLFPPFPRKKSVFVAMGFDAVFDSRWDKVIKPAIEQVEIDGVKLKAERVDTRNVSDSILTEIEEGISACLLVFVDITSTAVLDGRPIRNGNVMYELGLAHAIRRPEEVLIFRSDNEQMLFDTANCRALSYDPDGNSVDALSKLTEVIDGALGELDILKNKTVEKIAGSIDGLGFAVLAHCSATHGFRPPPRTRDIGQIITFSANWDTLRHLSDIGLVHCDFSNVDLSKLEPNGFAQFDDVAAYRLTKLGWAVYRKLVEPMREQLIDVAERFGVKPKDDSSDSKQG